MLSAQLFGVKTEELKKQSVPSGKYSYFKEIGGLLRVTR
jgi:hypothetical protein